jgi:hypothetical protein
LELLKTGHNAKNVASRKDALLKPHCGGEAYEEAVLQVVMFLRGNVVGVNHLLQQLDERVLQDAGS